MEKIKLDNTQIPLHYQIADYLMYMLRKGELDNIDKLPTEEKLTEIFDVSRTTIRKALDHLLKKGYINRKQGKGTFWTDSIKNIQQEKLSGINRQIFAVQEATTVKVLSKKPVKTNNEITEFFGNNDDVIAFKRIRYIGKEPMSFTVNYLPVEIGDLISRKQLEEYTMLESLETIAKINLGTIHHEVEITRANSEISELLKVAVLDPVLTIKTSVYATDSSPVEVVWTYFVENMYKFRVVLENDR
jgi:GntR family transcriptional regulator